MSSPLASNLLQSRAALAALALCPLAAASADTSSPRVLRVEAVVAAPIAQVWRAWTTSDGASEFLAPRVQIDLQRGGAFDVFFDPKDATKSSRGRVLGFDDGRALSVAWHLPPLYPELQQASMKVVVTLSSKGPAGTAVAIEQFGWGVGPRWDDAFVHMKQGWSDALGRLQHRFDAGPIDWMAEMAHGPGRRDFTLKERSPAQK